MQQPSIITISQNAVKATAIASVSAISLLGGLASAQAQEDAADTVTYDTVVVTATKRAENIQDVPISVTAISGDQLDNLGVTDIQGVARRTPGLQFGNFSDLKLATTAIRGVNAIDATSAGKDPAVAYYLDEVFLGIGAGAAVDFFDIERVEVLRGPQGTLFGRNSIGGVINITTRKPSDEFEGSAQIEGGNLGYMLARGSMNVPIKEDLLAVKLSGSFMQRDGFTENRFLNIDTNDAIRRNARASIRFSPEGWGEYLLTADYRNYNQHSKQYETLSYDEDSTFFAVATGNVPGFSAVPLNTDPYDRDVYSDVIASERLEGFGVSLKSENDLGFADLIWVSAYREHEYF